MAVTPAVRLALDNFLASVERNAFYRAKLAVGNENDALDIVQNAMLKLVSTYHHKQASEWRLLFSKILESQILDWYRKQSVRNRWQLWLEHLDIKTNDDKRENDLNINPIEQLADDSVLSEIDQIAISRSTQELTTALQSLPLRQQQAFLLRLWDNLSVKETAVVMKCSEGSVKTHLSRAVQRLKTSITEYQNE
jgi:RNA polymerase sigma-70 factor (ECF subfamily)